MASTIKRIHLALTKETLKELDHLSELFQESKGEVIKRAIALLYYFKVSEKDDSKK